MVNECPRQRHVYTWKSFLHANCRWESLDMCSYFHGREEDIVMWLYGQWRKWIYNWYNEISIVWVGHKKRGMSYQTYTNGRLLVLQMVWHSRRMALIVVTFHVCSHNFFLVTVPFLLYRMILLINNTEN